MVKAKTRDLKCVDWQLKLGTAVQLYLLEPCHFYKAFPGSRQKSVDRDKHPSQTRRDLNIWDWHQNSPERVLKLYLRNTFWNGDSKLVYTINCIMVQLIRFIIFRWYSDPWFVGRSSYKTRLRACSSVVLLYVSPKRKLHALHVNETLLATCTHSVPIEAKTSWSLRKISAWALKEKFFRSVFSSCYGACLQNTTLL